MRGTEPDWGVLSPWAAPAWHLQTCLEMVTTAMQEVRGKVENIQSNNSWLHGLVHIQFMTCCLFSPPHTLVCSEQMGAWKLKSSACILTSFLCILPPIEGFLHVLSSLRRLKWTIDQFYEWAQTIWRDKPLHLLWGFFISSRWKNTIQHQPLIMILILASCVL